MEQIIYDALKHKIPIGAVSTNSPVLMIVRLSKSIATDSLCMVLRYIDDDIGSKIFFTKADEDDDYVSYKLSFSTEKEGIYFYRFEINTPHGIKFVGRDSLYRAVIQDFSPEWQLTVYKQGFTVPKATRGNITYQIFVDRFNKGKSLPFTKKGVLKQWDEPLTIADNDGVYRANDFYGGNLSGITDMLGYIKSLGVRNIYLSPIFESSSNHRYDTGDYLKIDSLLGNEDDLKELIEKAGNLGIGIMLDGVFNHTGADSLYFNKFGHYPSTGAYQSKSSPYYDWYSFTEFPDEYACWWGITVVPTVTNKESPSFQRLIFDEVLTKWTKFGISGWRLDVVDELPQYFVDKIRKTVKNINKEAVIIGEVWEDASTKVSYSARRPYLLGGQLDGVMNYPFKEAIVGYLLKNDAKQFWEKVIPIINNYPTEALESSLTLLDSHDTYRIINVLSKADVSDTTKKQRQDYVFSQAEYDAAKRLLKLGVVLQYSLIGSPTVFYGDEQGITGWDDPLSRPTFRLKDNELYEFYVRMGKIHEEYLDAFIGGFTAEYNIDYIKLSRVGIENTVMVIVNNNDGDREIVLDSDYIDLMDKKYYYRGEKTIVLNKSFLLLKKIR